MAKRRAYLDLHKGLVLAQEQRQNLSVVVPARKEKYTPAWVEFERLVMLAQVNALRGREGKAPVYYEDIVKAENQAAGHSDYAVKYALACEDLVRRA